MVDINRVNEKIKIFLLNANVVYMPRDFIQVLK